ncbi:nitrile hydratase subunit alpha [Natronorubrum sp. A-ect3]|uniref:nitrile hydratase subunit alpha n=1 Tax=Natronorubrum sp. A-ect3 TaxID=3242698 RepID=UPI00359EE406
MSEPHPVETTDPEDRARAIQSLLIEKGLASTDAIDEIVSKYEEDIGSMNGARAVAKAWTDPEYKEWLLSDASTALDELGYTGLEGVDLGVYENTPEVHNVIVCTLCSCFPWPTLGLPPTWYKAPPYRAKMVKYPRRTLREEFDLDLDDDIEIKVRDTSAEVRYMVLPQRPAGTEGMSEEELAELITRDSMIGVERLGEKHADELR